MKILHFKSLITLISVILINVSYAQNGQWLNNDEKKGILITYDFRLTVENGDSSLLLNLTINDKQSNQTFDYGEISLNSRNVLDSNYLSGLLQNKYAVLWKQFGRETILRHSSYLSTMVLNLKDTISQRNQHSFVYQGLFMYQSLLNGANKDTKNTGSVDFTVMSSYILVGSSFVCEEEVYINIADFKNYLEERKKWDKENKGIDYYLETLKNEKSIELNMVEITVRLEEYFQSQFGRWPQGGECGCCMNYSGPCYYWNKICLAHDMACQKCQHSWCFSGCVPTSCSGNTISWYWWLVMN